VRLASLPSKNSILKIPAKETPWPKSRLNVIGGGGRREEEVRIISYQNFPL
jgi:hypothetical protein